MEFITLIVEQLIDPVKKHLGFLVCSSNNVRDMKARFVRLNVTADEMKRKKGTHEENTQFVPGLVPGWLTEFEKINEEVGRITTGGDECFNIKKRYQAGKTSSNLITRIDDLEKQESNIKWTKEQIPLDIVTPPMPSTSGPAHADADDNQNNIFKSRKLIFEDVLKALDPSSETQKMAICGIGGVGKTTMMEELKEVMGRKKLYDRVVRVVIGKKSDATAYQQVIAEFIGLPLSETEEVARKDRLKTKFSEMSQNGAKKILVILDDVWEKIDLEVIGLESPLPRGFKLLLTSRDEKVCTQMDVETNSIFKIVCLNDEEAKHLFWENVRVSSDDGDGAEDEYRKLGEDILKMCGGLPMAIKTIASSLRGDKKDAWEAALLRLKRHDLEGLDSIMDHIFEISYQNLKKDDKAVFVLSGLYPDDFDIPVEDLTRYGWGLNLFYKASSLAEARKRTNASVDNLKRANLLTEGYYTGCVKMHDLARAFVLNDISKFRQASVINHDDASEWPTEDTTECCERILVNCNGMSKFSQDFNYPNLVLLKLMTNQKENLKFPEDFYQRMKKLQVISFENLKYPLLWPVSIQCSASLRTLCLHSCSLLGDISFLGDFINMEVLSFDYCSIQKLPSTIGKLTKLKLLDLTRCPDLSVDASVFLELDKLEELYMGVFGNKAIMFTEDNLNEVEILLGKLSALDVEFFNNNLQPKNVSFKKLQRFRISMGCLLGFYSVKDSYMNTLKLAINSREILECKINVLFEKTEELELTVKDLNHLEEILQHPPINSFCNLKILSISDCADMKFLFTIPVANGMKKLETLRVSSCPVLKSLIHIENNGVREISFPKLASLTLERLPDLVSLCESVMNVIELPQLMTLRLDDLPNITSIFPGKDSDISSTQLFLSKKAVIPKMEILTIRRMEKLKEIWSCSSDRDEKVNDNISMLREIEVDECDNVVNMFPSNPMRLLSHLQDLTVENCCSIEVLFNIDLGKTQQLSSKSSLRKIRVRYLEKLKEVWRIKDAKNYSSLLICAFQGVESIHIWKCEKFRNVFAPTTANFDLGALKDINIDSCGKESGRNDAELIEVESEEVMGDNRKSSHFAFSSHDQLTHTYHHLRKIIFWCFERVEVVFEIETKSSQSINTETSPQQPFQLFPYLKKLQLNSMEMLTHVWKCNWNELILHMKHQPQPSTSFQNLTTISLFYCKSIKYLLSPLMAKLLSSLKNINIEGCHGMNEVVSSRDDAHDEDHVEMDTTILFPHLHTLDLNRLNNLKRIGGGGGGGKSSTKAGTCDINDKFLQAGVVSWSLYQYARKIDIYFCPLLVEVFETREMNNSGYSSCTNNVDQGSIHTALAITRPKDITTHKLSNLKILKISNCDRLEFIFTSLSLESLSQLEKLSIRQCEAMKVIVREENEEQITGSNKVVVFPRLKSIELRRLPSLTGFFLGKNDFEWPLLNFVLIDDCSRIKVFTSGESRTPQLNYIHSSWGRHNLECGLNFHPATTLHEVLGYKSAQTCEETSQES